MVRVTILNHDELIHRASGVHFKPTVVEGAWLGTAEVEEAVAEAFFSSSPELFRIEPLEADAPRPEPTPAPVSAPEGGVSEGAPSAPETASAAPAPKVVPDFARMDYAELKELAKLADVSLPGNPSKAALVAALHAHAAK